MRSVGELTKRGGPSGSPMLITLDSSREMAEPNAGISQLTRRTLGLRVRDRRRDDCGRLQRGQGDLLRRLGRRSCSIFCFCAECEVVLAACSGGVGELEYGEDEELPAALDGWRWW